MTASRLASWALFLTSAADLGAWIGTHFLGLQIQSEVSRGAASLVMAGLLACLGWLVRRGNSLALTLAIGLSLFDIVTGICLSSGSGSLMGAGDVLRVILFAMLVGSPWANRLHPGVVQVAGVAERTEGKEPRPNVAEVRATEAEWTSDEVAPLEAAPATSTALPAQGRFGRALFGLLVLVGCGLAAMVWKTLFTCDPRIPRDMQLGCVLSPFPTPEPFPIEGVRQLTFDSTYYEQLMWSPAGDYLLATRCQVLQWEARCYADQQPILIDLASGEARELDLSWYPTDAASIEFQSYLWSSEGDELLLDFREVFIPTPLPSQTPTPLWNRQYVSHRVILDLATRDYVEIQIGDVWPIAWLDNEVRIFGIRRGEYDQEAGYSIDSFGWYDYQADRWEENFKLSSDNYGKTLTLSPDRITVLLGRDLSNSHCRGQVLVYQLEAETARFTDISGACFPSYSHDGSRLAFSVVPEGHIWPYGVWIAEADGSNPQPLFAVESPESTSSISWSPDGSEIAFTYGYHYNAIYVINVPRHLQP